MCSASQENRSNVQDRFEEVSWLNQTEIELCFLPSIADAKQEKSLWRVHRNRAIVTFFRSTIQHLSFQEDNQGKPLRPRWKRFRSSWDNKIRQPCISPWISYDVVSKASQIILDLTERVKTRFEETEHRGFSDNRDRKHNNIELQANNKNK